mmetsp:Transcript_28961/g.47418  ORF Transcript_28961/g.47418 Transcript_28961/m.47418 type:complete len:92 (-) Transcript_28961:100-375(-)
MMQVAQSGSSGTTQRAAQPEKHPKHSNHPPKSQLLFSHAASQPSSQLQQKTLHAPLPQQPKFGFLLQQTPLLTANNVDNAKHTKYEFIFSW